MKYAVDACATHYIILADDANYQYLSENVPENRKVSDVIAACQRKNLRVVEVVEVPRPKSGPTPHVGEEILIPPRDFHTGGVAKIKSVHPQISAGEPAWFVRLEEVSGSFNYTWLLGEQERLRAYYKDQRAREDC
jgi:hypothetical protein